MFRFPNSFLFNKRILLGNRDMSDIRITYTGFLSFFIAILTTITGTVFTIILTRSLSQEEYGTWGLIIGIIGYVMIINLIISYWSTRETARKIESGKTAVLGTMLLSVLAVSIYILISFFMSKQTQIDSEVLLLSSILIPPMFLLGILNAINLGYKPHVISYGTLAFGLVQIPLVLLFVYFMDLGVNGIIFTNFIAYCINILILLKFAKIHLHNPLKLLFFKSWLRLSWIPIYLGLFILFDTLGILIFSLFTSSILGIAIWTASNVTPGIINNVFFISRAVYPKLLEGGQKSYIRDNITHLFYFNFVVTGIVIVFAKPALYALNPIYLDAFVVVIILAIRNFLLVLITTFIQNLSGNETIDASVNPTFMQYIKSKIFYPYTIQIVHASVFISLLPVGLLYLINNGYETIDLLILWASLLLLVTIPLTIYLYMISKKNLDFVIDFKTISKYFISCILVFSLAYVLVENILVYSENLLEFIPDVLPLIGLVILAYYGLTFILDQKIRHLSYSIINELRNRKSI